MRHFEVIELQQWWWCFGDTLEYGLSRDSTIFYTWELIWSRIMGITWIDETRAYLFLWRLEVGTLQMMERTSWTWMEHTESWWDDLFTLEGHTHGQHVADNSGSTYVAVMFALCEGVNIIDNGTLSRTTMISGGGECYASGWSCDGQSVHEGARAHGGRAPNEHVTLICNDMRHECDDRCDGRKNAEMDKGSKSHLGTHIMDMRWHIYMWRTVGNDI